MTLKNIGAPLELWEELSHNSKHIKHNDCKNRWFMFKENKYTVGSLRYRAKEGNLDMCNKTKSEQYTLADVFDDGNVYDVNDIDTPFLKPKNKDDPMNKGQKVFKKRFVSS